MTIPEPEYLLQRGRKAQMLAHLNSHPGDFEKAVALAVSNQQPAAWRAAWLLSGAVVKYDARLLPHVNAMVNALEHVQHQRELLKILLVMNLNEEQQGTVYGTCLKLWQQIQNQPSLRHNALKTMLHIAADIPELKAEIRLVTEDVYLESLSHGIRHSVEKMLRKAGI